MARIKDQAICVRLIDWSETSQIVAWVTETHGLIRGIAKGSKRFSPSSLQRFSGGIELLTAGQIVGQLKPTADLMTLTEWNLEKPWWPLRKNLPVYRLAMYGADLVGAILAEHDPHPRTFAALHRFLTQLAQESPPPPETDRQLALLQFQWAILQDAGYQPNLTDDVLTHQPLQLRSNCQFHPAKGGFSHRKETHSWGVRKQTLDLLRHIATSPTSTSVTPTTTLSTNPSETSPPGPPLLNTQPPEPQALQRANQLLCAYLRTLLDQQLPTMRYILEPETQRLATPKPLR